MLNIKQIIFIILLIVFSKQAIAQNKLSSEQVAQALEYKISRNASEPDIWNTGYDFFRIYPQNQDTAKAIEQGFLKVKGNNKEQSEALVKAAIYWQKIHDYGINNVPVAVNNADIGRPYLSKTKPKSTLKLAQPKQKYYNKNN